MKYRYLRYNRHSHPVGCIAYTVEGNSCKYGVSVLNPTKTLVKGGVEFTTRNGRTATTRDRKVADKFDRKTARTIATEHLTNQPRSITVKDPNQSYLVVKDIMQDISTNKTLPGRARREAKVWLMCNVLTPLE